MRARGTVHFRRAFEHCDVIATPSTPCVAPPITAAAAAGGASDLGLVSKIMRFASQVWGGRGCGLAPPDLPPVRLSAACTPTACSHTRLQANLLGLPAISVPVGRDPDSQLPVGLQVRPAAVHEAVRHRVAHVSHALWIGLIIDPSLPLIFTLQFIGKPWAEATLLRLAGVMEAAIRPRTKVTSCTIILAEWLIAIYVCAGAMIHSSAWQLFSLLLWLADYLLLKLRLLPASSCRARPRVRLPRSGLTP